MGEKSRYSADGLRTEMIKNGFAVDSKGQRDLNKYERDKERMDEIAERLSERQDIWQDRYVYWIAVAVGHILEWVVRHEK